MGLKALVTIIAKSFIEVAWSSRENDIKVLQDDLICARKHIGKNDIMFYLISVLAIILPIVCVIIFFSLTTPMKIATTFIGPAFLIKVIRNAAKEIKRYYRIPKKIDKSEI